LALDLQEMFFAAAFVMLGGVTDVSAALLQATCCVHVAQTFG
jgi:hypothetical protein